MSGQTINSEREDRLECGSEIWIPAMPAPVGVGIAVRAATLAVLAAGSKSIRTADKAAHTPRWRSTR